MWLTAIAGRCVMTLTDAEVERWKHDLDSGDKWREAEAAEVLSQSFSSDDTDHIITACDYLWREIDRIGDFIELTYTIPRNLAPQATLTLKGDHHLVPLFRTCTQTMVGITIETAGISEAFYVKRHREKLGPDGVWTHVLELVGVYDILNYLVIWPSWYLPIQSQPFSHAIYAAPICTAIESMAAEQSLRIQSGMWEFVNNFLSGNPDVRSYFGTVLQGLKRDGKPSTILKTPLYVVRTGLLRDSSQVYVKTVRMQTVGQIITEITAAYGVDVRVHLWRPGDPQPDQWANLEVPTYVMTVRDRTQIEGPTKSILDSALRLVVDVQGSLLGNTLSPLLNPDGKYAPEGLYIAPRLGINFVMPYAMIVTPDNVITEDGDVVRERSPLVSCEIAHNTPLGWQHIIGGKCVAGETLAHTAEGLIPVKELVGRTVLTLSADGVYRPAEWKTYGEQQLYKVVFDNGDHIFATDTHEWVAVGRNKRIATVDLVGERIPRVAHADRYGRQDYLAVDGTSAVVVRVEETDRYETVYCCEEPVTNTWVAGDGYLTSNSPKWLNDLINAFFAYVIDVAMIVIGFTGVPSNLLDGFMNDSFLAFQLIEHYARRNSVGPYHPAIEVFTSTNSAPYNVEALFQFIQVLWNSRGYTTAIATFRGQNGPYKLGRDIFPGALFILVYASRTKLYTDYIELVSGKVNRNTRELTVQMGDGKPLEHPIAQIRRNISETMAAINVASLAPNSG